MSDPSASAGDTVPRDVVRALRKARALVFDFDGTLVRSNELKWRAFDLCFEDVAERREEIAAYCRSLHHTPREEKFRYVYERMLSRPYTEDVRARLHARFEAATTAAVVAAPEVPGAARFLECVVRTRPLGLLSSTPQAVLESIVQRRGWSHFFQVIKGAPVDKATWLERYRAERRLAEGELLMFGDTAEDAAAAARAGCAFVGVGAEPALAGLAWRLVDFTDFAGDAGA